MSNKKFSAAISGKGYYIALILCAVAIGITGYLYYQSKTNEQAAAQQPQASVDASQEDMQAAATNPPSSTPVPSQSGTAKPTTPQKLATVAPLTGETVSAYAVDCLSYNQTTRDWRTHDGVDIAAPAGTAVCAAAAGEVYSVYEDETMGTTVVIVHEGGYATRYASLDPEVRVTAGERVNAGQVIGSVGTSALLEAAIGEHLHFSVSCNDRSVDPADFLS